MGMDVAGFVKLSTSLCNDLRVWVDEARRQAILSEGQLLTLSDAADVIARATNALTTGLPGADGQEDVRGDSGR